jgi:hypothetical protein
MSQPSAISAALRPKKRIGVVIRWLSLWFSSGFTAVATPAMPHAAPTTTNVIPQPLRVFGNSASEPRGQPVNVAVDNAATTTSASPRRDRVCMSPPLLIVRAPAPSLVASTREAEVRYPARPWKPPIPSSS